MAPRCDPDGKFTRNAGENAWCIAGCIRVGGRVLSAHQDKRLAATHPPRECTPLRSKRPRKQHTRRLIHEYDAHRPSMKGIHPRDASTKPWQRAGLPSQAYRRSIIENPLVDAIYPPKKAHLSTGTQSGYHSGLGFPPGWSPKTNLQVQLSGLGCPLPRRTCSIPVGDIRSAKYYFLCYYKSP